MRLIPVYAARAHRDQTEGKMGMYTFAYFTRRPDAAEAVKGRGVWGGDGEVVKDIITVFDTLDEWLLNQ